MKFFLTAVWEVATEASASARDIVAMREEHRQVIQDLVPGSVNGLELLDRLYRQPYVSVPGAAELLDDSYPTANSLIGRLEELDLLEEITGRERYRIFRYGPYLRLLNTEVQRVAST